MDPDPAIFVSDLQDVNKKVLFFQSSFAYYFLKVHVHNFSKIKSHRTVGSMFFLLILLDDRRIRFGRLKNIRILIRKTAKNSEFVSLKIVSF